MEPGRSALIIANSEYKDPELRRLRSPAQDAEELESVLRDPRIGGFNVRVSKNMRCHEVQRDIEAFFHNRGLDDLLLLHFSCHGIKDDSGHLFFAAADTDRDLLNATAIRADFVNDLMNECRSKNIVLLLDCCYSGAFTREMIPRGDDGVGANVSVTERFRGTGRAILTASTALEYAWEDGTLTGEGKPSIFTSAVVEGLRTGDADRDRDGLISVDELYDFVFQRVRQATHKQTPNKWTNVQGPLIVAHSVLGAATPSSELPSDVVNAVMSPLAWIREGAVSELRRLARSPIPDLASKARAALVELSQDDSQRVSAAARAVLDELAGAIGTLDPTVPNIRTGIGGPKSSTHARTAEPSSADVTVGGAARSAPDSVEHADPSTVGRGTPPGGTPVRQPVVGHAESAGGDDGSGLISAGSATRSPAEEMQALGLVTAISWLVGAGIGESLFFLDRHPVLGMKISIGWGIGGAMAALMAGLSSSTSPRRWGRMLAAIGIATITAMVSDAIIYWEFRVDSASLAAAVRAPIAAAGVRNEYMMLSILAMLGGAISGAIGGVLAVITMHCPRRISHRKEVLVVAVSAAIGALSGVAISWSLPPPLKYFSWFFWALLGALVLLRQAGPARR